MTSRIPVVVSGSVSADQFRAAAGPEALDGEPLALDGELLVVAPALQDSALRFWMSNVDAAIDRAWTVQKNTVRRLQQDGVNATGDTR